MQFCRAPLCRIRAEGINPSNSRENRRQEWELSFALFTVEQISSSCDFSPDLLISVMLPCESPHVPLLLQSLGANTTHVWVLGSHSQRLRCSKVLHSQTGAFFPPKAAVMLCEVRKVQQQLWSWVEIREMMPASRLVSSARKTRKILLCTCVSVLSNP